MKPDKVICWLFLGADPAQNWAKYKRWLCVLLQLTNRGIAIEGFCAKSAYIAFWAAFYFLQDRANFWQTDLF